MSRYDMKLTRINDPVSLCGAAGGFGAGRMQQGACACARAGRAGGRAFHLPGIEGKPEVASAASPANQGGIGRVRYGAHRGLQAWQDAFGGQLYRRADLCSRCFRGALALRVNGSGNFRSFDASQP